MRCGANGGSRSWRPFAVEGILNDFRRYPLRVHSGEWLYDVAWPLAQGSGRTFYDSLYLALAMSNACLMVTADLRFYDAVKDTLWGRHCLWVEDVP